MKEFFKRSVTALFLAVLLITCVVLNRYSFIFLVLIINVSGLLEFYRLFRKAGIHASVVSGTLLSVILFVTSVMTVTGILSWNYLLLNIPLASFIFISRLFTKSEKPFLHLSFTFMGIFYITIPSILLAWIAFLPFDTGIYHPTMILGYIFIVWASDSGAYVIGKLTGKHPLFKRISPGKTWEGSMGGALCAVVTAIVVSRFYHDLSLPGWITVSQIVILFGTFGDLIKSMLKRSLDVKDSGNILPGHGGILDRFDSMLGSAPFVFIYLSVFS